MVARVLRLGRSLVFGEIEVLDPSGRLKDRMDFKGYRSGHMMCGALRIRRSRSARALRTSANSPCSR